MRHRYGNSSVGLEIGKFVFKELLSSKSKSRWRIGNDIKNCRLCGKCESVCSRRAINVSVHNRTWTLNNSRCSHCFGCVMACPARCLSQVRI